jgi:Tol biopolymer transport system component
MYPYRDFMSWSPDGAQLALAVPAAPDGSGNSSTQLVVASANGDKPEVVSAATQTVGDLAWSPDGHYIAYAANNTGAATAGATGRRIWLVTPDGAERRPVTLGPDDEFPQWSRDGKTLVYVHQTANGAEVWSVAPAGKGGPHREIAGLVGLHDLARQFFGASGLISYRGIFAWSAAAAAQ